MRTNMHGPASSEQLRLTQSTKPVYYAGAGTQVMTLAEDIMAQADYFVVVFQITSTDFSLLFI